jgi:hypothetical protein
MVAIRRLFGRNTYNNRFKTFIAHDGVFNASMFGQLGSFLQQLGFGGPYWER